MSHFGGGTMFGGGAVFGGGPSLYEAWRTNLIEWLGRHAFDTEEGTNVRALMGSVAGQGEGAQVDGYRVVTEALAPLAVETLTEWEYLCRFVSELPDSDSRRTALAWLWEGAGLTTTTALAQAHAEEMIASSGSGMGGTPLAYQCTNAQALAADDNGQGVRYWCVRLPEWMWLPTWRPYYYQLLSWMERQDPTGSEASCPIPYPTAASEPGFYCGISIVERDTVRN